MFHNPLLSPYNSVSRTWSGADPQKIVVIDCKGMSKSGSKCRHIWILNHSSLSLKMQDFATRFKNFQGEAPLTPPPPTSKRGKPLPALSLLVASRLGRLPSAAGLVVNEQDYWNVEYTSPVDYNGKKKLVSNPALCIKQGLRYHMVGFPINL
jgi:hypothetical protein